MRDVLVECCRQEEKWSTKRCHCGKPSEFHVNYSWRQSLQML